VRLTIREAIGAAQAAAIDTTKVDSFRLLTGGLTRRALLLAITVETLLLGEYLRASPPNWLWKRLVSRLSFRGPGACPIRYSKLSLVAPYFKKNNRRLYYAAQQILKDLEDAWQLPSMDQGGLNEDILLAMRFLKFIYCEADWSKGLPDPDLSPRSCRDHQFMVTYLQVGLYAPLVR
jgi:hypothetical protein